MRTSLKLASLWIGAALVALALSWFAVSQVRNRVIQPSRVISTTLVAIDPDTDPDVVVVVPETTSTSATLDPTTSTRVTSGSSTTSPTSSGSGGTAAQPGATSSTAPPSTQPSSSSTSTASTATTSTASTTSTTTTTVPAQAANSSHSLTGGVVTISSSPGVVTFVSAVPQAGYTTEVRESGPDRVRVRFIGATHTSEFEAEWDGGQLDISTKESDGDD